MFWSLIAIAIAVVGVFGYKFLTDFAEETSSRGLRHVAEVFLALTALAFILLIVWQTGYTIW